MCRGPHLPSTGKLDPDAFKLMRVAGALLARRPEECAADAHLWHRLAQQEAVERPPHPAGGSRQARPPQAGARDGSVPPAGRGPRQRLSGTPRATASGASWKPICAARWTVPATARFKTPAGGWTHASGSNRVHLGQVPAKTCSSSPTKCRTPRMKAPVISGEAEWMALKPMNCPAHVLVFKQGITSYRDLPIRLGEMGCCHRNEPHGALHGLMRVRQFTQDDAHIFCTEGQVVAEVQDFIALADSVYRDFGFTYDIKLALRPDQRFGSDADWDKAEQELRDALTANGLEWEELPGEGAFYAPKLEWHLDRRDRADVAGRHDPVRPGAARTARRALYRRGWWTSTVR